METVIPRKAKWALAACMAGISVSAALNKVAVASGLHPVWLNVLRMGFSVAFLLPFFLQRKGSFRAIKELSGREKLLTILSGFMLAIHFAAWTASLSLADSFVAVTIWSTFSLMTVIGSSLILRERTPAPALLGIVVATVGVGICAIGASGSQLTGVLLALTAAFTQAIYTLCGRVVRRKLDTLPYTVVVYSIAFVGLLFCALVFRIPSGGITWQGAGAALALALVCTLGGHSLQNYALKYFKAPTVSTAMLTEVFTGPLLVFIIFGEAPKVASILGGLVILAGVAWYMIYEWRVSSGRV